MSDVIVELVKTTRKRSSARVTSKMEHSKKANNPERELDLQDDLDDLHDLKLQSDLQERIHMTT